MTYWSFGKTVHIFQEEETDLCERSLSPPEDGKINKEARLLFLSR